jgi:hypothetical protein
VPYLGWLEIRRLLAGAPALVAGAIPLPLDTPLVGALAPLGTSYYQVSSDLGGKLTVTLTASAQLSARVSLVDSTGAPLVESDGSATGSGLIDVNVPAGNDLLEVQSVGGGGTYQILAEMIPTAPAFQVIGSQFAYPAIGVGDFLGNGITDIVAPDGIHVGVGDGTFESDVIDGPLGQSGYTVTAIAVADFNNDGLPDIAFAENCTQDNSANVCVLQNLGGGQFKPVATFDVDPDPVAIQAIKFGGGIVDLAVADAVTGKVAIFVGNGLGGFSVGPVLTGCDDPSAMVSGQFGDGHVDLIVADQGDSSTGAGPGLTVFQDNGPGQFQFAGTIAVGTGPSAVAAGDFTGTGVLDLAVADANSNQVLVLLNKGNGTFDAPETFAVGEAPRSIVAVDLGNGHVDLAVANENSDDVSILLGNGAGGFAPQLRFETGSFPAGLVTADFNGDKRPDLAVANLEGAGDISVLLGRGDGTFQDSVTNLVGDDPVAAVTADVNHDGYLDIITTNTDTNDISVLLGNGDGTFEASQSFAAGPGPTGLVVGDFNGDGRLDVAVADGGNSNSDLQGVSILLGNGDGTFHATDFYPTGGYPSSITAGDFLGNGVLDLAVTIPSADEVLILLGNGQGEFPTENTVSLGDQAADPISIVPGDFTDDGILDLAVLNQETGNVSILQGDGRGNFQALSPPISLDLPLDTPQALAAGDFTGNGKLDLAVTSAGFLGPDHVSILLNQGNGVFGAPQAISLGTGLDPTAVVTGPFFGSGPLGLAVLDAATGAVSLLQGDGFGGFVPVTSVDIGTGLYPTTIAAGDLTGDGELDLVVGLQTSNIVAIELNQGNGQFAQPDSVGLVPRNTPVVADFTGDGVPDIAIVDGAGDIFFRQGLANRPGSFEPPVTINSGVPSRDIAAVATNQGVLLASVDATGNAVSWFAYHNGQFRLMGTLATGLEPAQIVSANLNSGGGDDDLIIRNAGDGTLTIYMSNPLAGGFLPRITLTVGPGISNVSVADINQDGRPDILLANQTSGLVEVISNDGDGRFSQPTLYRAGVGLSAVIGGTGTTPISLFSQDGTIGVAAATPVRGGSPEIVAVNSGAETLGVLTSLGNGRFANPYSLPMTGPAQVVRVADLTGHGVDDLVILGADGVTIWLGNGQGGFSQETTYNVGPDPTGLTIADGYGDKVPDIFVGNAFGDVLVLLGEGNGLFQHPTLVDQSVALAVTYPRGSRNPTFIYSDQASDSVVVKSGSQVPEVLGNRTTGLLAPGAPVLADLNGDGIPDLIVVNTGANDVLVYPGLPGGGFGPALNNGNGFATGTNPVAVVVANLNGRPDLIVADEGSNDVTILFNEPQGNSFTFVPGPRINAGQGPVGLLYGDMYGNGTDDLVVSDSGSNSIMVLPSLGNGFFDDANPTVISQSSGQIFAGLFGSATGLDIVALDPENSEVTLISGLSTGSPTSQAFSSGGLHPDAAFTVTGSNGFDDLVVANYVDGRVALLTGGPQGLTLAQVDDSLDLQNPTGLALASLQNNNLEVYAATAGQESATLLGFSLGGLGGSSSSRDSHALTLLPLSDSSLPLIATLLTPTLNLNATNEETSGSAQQVAAVVALATTATGLGQGPFLRKAGDGDVGDSELADESGAVTAAGTEKAGLSPWRRIEMGLDEAFEEFRRATQTKTPHADGPAADDENELPDPAPQAAPPVRAGQVGVSDRSAMVDAAIDALAARDPVTPVIPALGCTTPPGMTNGRLKASLLSSTALVILHAGLLARPPYSLASRWRAGRCDWRTSENHKPGEIPQEDA